jgi:hypothetical protein
MAGFESQGSVIQAKNAKPPDRVPRRTVGWLHCGTNGDGYPRAFLIASSSMPLMVITLDADE